MNLLMGNLKKVSIEKLFKKIFGSRNDRLLSDYSKIVDEINLLRIN